MADEHAETGAHGSDGGISGGSSLAAAHDAARAAFLAGDMGDDDTAAEDAKKAPAARDADDDSDLDEDESEEVSADDEEDPDKDLDDEEDEDDEDETDKETARRIEQVQRTDKRLREERERQFAAREAELEQHVSSLKKEWEPRIAAAEKFERLAARANIDPVAVVKALGVGKDRYEYIGQVFYTLAKAEGGDDKAKIAAAQLMKQSEYDAEIADLKKWREQREQADKDREQQTAADREVDAFISKVMQAATDKMALAKALLKNDPDTAREELQIVAFRLAKAEGKLPDAKKVMIEFEKHQRAKLRKLGLDPKTMSPKAASAALAADSAAKAAPAKGDKKAAVKKPTVAAAAVGGDKPLSREDFVRLNGNYD